MSKPTQYEKVIDPTRLCYYCDQPATRSWEVRLSRQYSDSVEIIDVLAHKLVPTRGYIAITADACPEHDVALTESLMDVTGGGVAGRDKLTEDTCPDPWHTDDEAYEETKTAPAYSGSTPNGDWYESHYECPTCGLSTGGTTVVPSSIRQDPAYLYVQEAIASLDTTGDTPHQES